MGCGGRDWERARELGLAGLLVLLGCGGLGCTGEVDAGAAGPQDGTGARGTDGRTIEVPPTRPTPPAGIDPVEIPDSRIWRLTPTQYVRSFEAAFGTSKLTAEELPSDPIQDGYDNNAGQIFVGGELGRLYYENATAMAAARTANLGAIDACLMAASPNDACVGAFITKFAEPAFRRPVDAAEVDAYLAVYRDVASTTNAKDAAAAVLELLAQSPHFLYRMELGEPTDGDETRLTQFEVASELSYMLTDGPPDAELYAAAVAGELYDRETVRAQATRLLEDPNARTKVGEFFAQYLQITGFKDASVAKDTASFPAYTPALQQAILDETVEFSRYVVFDGEGSLTELFTAPYSLLNGSLANLYGVAGVSGDALNRVDLPEGQARGGIMTHASVLAVRAKASDTDPLHRGLFVFRDLLCRNVSPPENVDATQDQSKLHAPVEDATKLEDFQFFQENSPSCAACHSLFVPFGLAFENFDAFGRFRETQFNKNLQTEGTLTIGSAQDGEFADGAELAAKIASSDMGQACFAQRYATFALGRETKVTPQTLLAADFRKAELSVAELLVAVTLDDVFYYRAVGRGEESP